METTAMTKTHVFKIPSPRDQQIIRHKIQYLKIAFYNSSKNPDNGLL